MHSACMAQVAPTKAPAEAALGTGTPSFNDSPEATELHGARAALHDQPAAHHADAARPAVTEAPAIQVSTSIP